MSSIGAIPWVEERSDGLDRNDPDARIYPCEDCGTMRSKNEGGTIFTVCDECWGKYWAKKKHQYETI